MDPKNAFRNVLRTCDKDGLLPYVMSELSTQFTKEELKEAMMKGLVDKLGRSFMIQLRGYWNRKFEEQRSAVINSLIDSVSDSKPGIAYGPISDYCEGFFRTGGTNPKRRLVIGQFLDSDSFEPIPMDVKRFEWAVKYTFGNNKNGKPMNPLCHFWTHNVSNVAIGANFDFIQMMTEDFWSKGELGPLIKEDLIKYKTDNKERLNAIRNSQFEEDRGRANKKLAELRENFVKSFDSKVG